jgi:Nitrile hydratase beta subunit
VARAAASANNARRNGLAPNYYEHWLAARERLVITKGLTDREVMGERKEAWTEAHRQPRTKPVELNAALRGQKVA